MLHALEVDLGMIQGVLGQSDTGIVANAYVHPERSVYTGAAAKMNAFLFPSGGDVGGTNGRDERGGTA